MVFAHFDEVPLAAASIAQVHAATLQTGEDVVVKVQRPRVARLVREDLQAMAWLAPRLVGRIPVAALANPPLTTVGQPIRQLGEQAADLLLSVVDRGRGEQAEPPRVLLPNQLMMRASSGPALN